MAGEDPNYSQDWVADRGDRLPAVRGGRATVRVEAGALRGYLGPLFERMLKQVVVDAQGAVTAAIYEKVVEVTPVLTSRARHHWRMDIDRKPHIVTSETAGLTETGAPITSEEKSRVQDIVQRLRRLAVGRKVYVTNALGYVAELDVGSSTKAPHGIRAVAVEAALGRARK